VTRNIFSSRSAAKSSRALTPAVHPCVSVIMAAYNAEATIGCALQSLVAQTLPDWEVVVVDDGSTDGTWAGIEGWMACDPRVRGIRLATNGKAPSALNHAIAAARGDWIAVIDADDWIRPERLRSLVVLGESLGCEVVADNQILFDAGAGKPVGTVLPTAPGWHKLTVGSYIARSITGLSRFDHGMLKPLVRRRFLEQSGVRYEAGCHDGYDFHFLLDLLAAGARAVIEHEPFYVYVQPVGVASRVVRRPNYRYGLMRQYNDRALSHYGAILAPAAVRGLRRRSRAISRFAGYIAAKEAFAAGAVGEAVAVLGRTPASLQHACLAVLVHLGIVRRVIPFPADRPDIAANLHPQGDGPFHQLRPAA
jgi:succinoglycan biosynthesis protein ExoO